MELDENSRSSILQSLYEMSTGALRCLAFAFRDELPEFESYDGSEDHPAHKLLLNPSNYSTIESGLVFAGLVGLRVSSVCVSSIFFRVWSNLFPTSSQANPVAWCTPYRILQEKKSIKPFRTAGHRASASWLSPEITRTQRKPYVAK